MILMRTALKDSAGEEVAAVQVRLSKLQYAKLHAAFNRRLGGNTPLQGLLGSVNNDERLALALRLLLFTDRKRVDDFFEKENLGLSLGEITVEAIGERGKL